MKNRKLTASEIKAAKESNSYNFTKTELEAVIQVQRKIIERQEEELNQLKYPNANSYGPEDDLPETD